MSFNKFIIHRLVNYLLPPTCIFCGQLSHTAHCLCLGCASDLPILSHHCRQCAQVLPGRHTDASRCGACLQHPPAFSRTHALFTYQPPIVRLITGLKFQRHLAHAAVTSDLFLDRIKAAWYQAEPLPDILLPMPLHDSRMQQRGYNQALEIAKPLAKACRMALDQNGIRRIKATQAQSGLSAKERAANLAGAFQAQTTYQDLRVAILDDVVTTGHTVNALANCLKQAGALDIHIWCVARA